MQQSLSQLLEHFYYYDPETGGVTHTLDYGKLISVLEDILNRLDKLEQS